VTDTHVAGPVGALVADRFRIDRLIGSGGMASVYQATDVLLGRPVALKLFRTDTTDPAETDRQSGEVAVLASLNHFALVTLYDAGNGVLDGAQRTFIVMEFIDGPDLRSRIAGGRLPATEVAELGADLAEALHYVHARGVIHRDIKPANVLLAPSDFPGRVWHAKLADFGIARLLDGTRLTATGALLGTASYLSPEQALGSAIGAPSDVYSLGLVLLECLTGERAYPGTAVESAIARLQRQPEIPDELGPEWGRVLEGMLAREPDDRLDAGNAAVALRELVGVAVELTAQTELLTAPAELVTASTTAATQRLPLPEPAAGAGPQPSRPSQPSRPKRVLIALVVLAVLIIAGIALYFALQPGPSAETPPSYPAVEGDLGTHLRQLQESVAP
jgi:serine/threonine protein kinase